MAHDSYMIYFRSDRDRAEALGAALAGAGHDAFVKDVHLLPGDLPDQVVPRALSSAGLILVLAPSKQDDWHAADEIIRAIRRAAADPDVRLVPIVFDDVDPTTLPYGLDRPHPIRAGAGDFGAVVASLSRLVDRTSTPPARRRDPQPPQPPPPPFDADDIAALVSATIRRRLDRDLLLSWLPAEVSTRLTTERSYFEQITADLTALNRFGRLPDGQQAIAVWLRQAERLAGPFAESRVFRGALERIARRD